MTVMALTARSICGLAHPAARLQRPQAVSRPAAPHRLCATLTLGHRGAEHRCARGGWLCLACLPAAAAAGACPSVVRPHPDYLLACRLATLVCKGGSKEGDIEATAAEGNVRGMGSWLDANRAAVWLPSVPQAAVPAGWLPCLLTATDGCACPSSLQGASALPAAAAAVAPEVDEEEAENNPELHPLKEALQRAKLRLEEATGIRWVGGVGGRGLEVRP